ncbi:MAG: bifunctional oligoribonuclease/PAP phosphatase NrnA [Desulforhabdus sp.]|jgi:phosphoesterase RecJ-like protein|nr:bifunctional oligoribonuclease/PAP phosphatase NrnA [Desulforhabdus sp.]
MSDANSPALLDVQLAIERYKRFAVATHVRPDGDAIGSLLGLTYMLRKLGKEADPYCQDPVPSAHRFLPGSRSIRHSIEQPSFYDAAILVDCGSLLRVGNALADSIGKIPFLINIDHHMNDTPFGDIFWVTPSVSSTCEMLYHLCGQLQLALDPDIAAQLYTGLLADTGSFRFSNTNRQVLALASALVEAGAQPAYIAEQLYESASPESIQLLARVLSTIAFSSDNRVATAELTQKMFAETHTLPEDSEGFINHLRSVKSVELAVLFREDDDNELVHVSMRSKGKIDVSAFARRHGGGGHRNAAAFRVSGKLDAIRSEYTEKALDYLAGAS